MKQIVALTAAAVGIALLGALPALAAGSLRGEYLEARTASVFAGACHYNGELTTAGREAVAVWHIESGSWNGVSLAGLNVMAAVKSAVNLKAEGADRRSVLYIDGTASPAQSAALTDAIKSSYGGQLGRVISVKHAHIAYSADAAGFSARVGRYGGVALSPMPNRECCKQPNLVWYSPLVPISNRRVGYVRSSSVKDRDLGVDWSKACQNSAFYGTFQL